MLMRTYYNCPAQYEKINRRDTEYLFISSVQVPQDRFRKWIKFTRQAEMKKIVQAYEAWGFPEAMGSYHVALIVWGRVASRVPGYAAKEGRFTIAYWVKVKSSKSNLNRSRSIRRRNWCLISFG